MDCQVTIYTRVYNTERFLPQCLDSVIGQSYKHFQHLIFDNGCTDGCTKILQDYAAQYPWVKLIRYEENQRTIDCIPWIDTPYFTVLDSDDWWEPDYLERLVSFLEENDLDLAVTGTKQYIQKLGVSQIMRKLEQPVVLTQRQFAQNYPQLWIFPSTSWASVQKTSIYKNTDFTGTLGLAYGGDTMQMLQYIKQCSRIGIDNSALYHYRIHPKSISFQFNSRRFDANIAYYEKIKEFLEFHQTFDPPKQEWLKRVHLSSMTATLSLLRDSALPAAGKLRECARIAVHPLTAVALTNHCNEQKQWFSLMWEIVLANAPKKAEAGLEDLRTILQVLAPDCAAVLHPANLGLFVREPELQKSLRENDRERLAHQILSLISQKQYTKQYDLGQMLCGLIPDDCPLHGISDIRFFRDYAESCTLILGKKYSEALEQMTGILFQKEKLYAGEVFLNLYLMLAALENEAHAFLFGKFQLAWLYLSQDRLPECRSVTDELAEMGVESEELDVLQKRLKEICG